MDPVTDPLKPWRALDAQRDSLPLEVQAIFILICVESVLAMRPVPDPEGQEYVRAIWDSLARDRSALSEVAESLGSRPDLDDRDDIAALYYAVAALGGSHDGARWGADRLRDDAYRRIPEVADDRSFGPLGDDTAHDVVQDELRWQRSILDSLQTVGRAVDCARLRESARARRPIDRG
ncbi:hypothetical protein [Isoptericola jiangsuensis]|uniref:hypothetical protein n=1 Tax=Isoptericola jiangsuensis TaxID=548579 RepID=UPI000BF3FBF7|nr:hypothetical protein [Isoptericola jiangsuensis]